MERVGHITFLGIRIGRFLFLFISIILMMVLRPILGGLVPLTILTDILFAAVLISGIWAVGQKRGFFLTSLLIALPALVLGWVTHCAKLPFIGILSRVFLTIFFVVVVVSLLSHIRRAKEVTADLIMGAASTYFLIGLFWAFIFFFIETVSPGSFRLEGSPADMESQLIYYSFVTLTTVGYGDVIPTSMIARSYSVLEAVIGQLYLTVLVAGLVGLHISHSTERKGWGTDRLS
jgi:voltage-gated potassium channel